MKHTDYDNIYIGLPEVNEMPYLPHPEPAGRSDIEALCLQPPRPLIVNGLA